LLKTSSIEDQLAENKLDRGSARRKLAALLAAAVASADNVGVASVFVFLRRIAELRLSQTSGLTCQFASTFCYSAASLSFGPSAQHLDTLQIIQMLRSCRQQDIPPHVYASAQLAYRNMLSSRRNQSSVFTGRSGSGKTTCLRHVLQHYAVAYGGSHSNALGSSCVRLSSLCCLALDTVCSLPCRQACAAAFARGRMLSFLLTASRKASYKA